MTKAKPKPVYTFTSEGALLKDGMLIMAAPAEELSAQQQAAVRCAHALCRLSICKQAYARPSDGKHALQAAGRLRGAALE